MNIPRQVFRRSACGGCGEAVYLMLSGRQVVQVRASSAKGWEVVFTPEAGHAEHRCHKSAARGGRHGKRRKPR